MAAFRPLGAQARWRSAYDRFLAAAPGDLITYVELAELMDVPLSRLSVIQQAVRHATARLERDDHRTVETVTGQGYCVAGVEGHLRGGVAHSRKANRSLARGLSKVVSCDLNTVDDPEIRRRFELVGSYIAAQVEFNHRAWDKLERHEEAMDLLRVAAARTKVDVADIQERLARLEKAQQKADAVVM